MVNNGRAKTDRQKTRHHRSYQLVKEKLDETHYTITKNATKNDKTDKKMESLDRLSKENYSDHKKRLGNRTERGE